jgi:hypothetical protein
MTFAFSVADKIRGINTVACQAAQLTGPGEVFSPGAVDQDQRDSRKIIRVISLVVHIS